ncbi:hypothetical protein FRC11_004739, partial [Ceratobasidium sp. 423]
APTIRTMEPFLLLLVHNLPSTRRFISLIRTLQSLIAEVKYITNEARTVDTNLVNCTEGTVTSIEA